MPIVTASHPNHQTLRCPFCGSASVKSVVAIYEQGTRISDFGGAGMTGRGRVGVFAGQSVSHSLAAQMVAPPQKRHSDYVGMGAAVVYFIAAFFLLLTGGLFSPNPSDRRGGLLGLILFLISIGTAIALTVLCVRWMKWNRTEHQRKLLAWSKLWHCSKCGGTCELKTEDAA